MVMADTSPHVGRGRGRTEYARFLELLRGTGHRLGLLTNGQQFRLVYAGLDFESWCEWESDRWFDDGEGTEELAWAAATSLARVAQAGQGGRLGAAGRRRGIPQAAGRSVRASCERTSGRRLSFCWKTFPRPTGYHADLFTALVQHGRPHPDRRRGPRSALMQATVRVVMRLVVCLFAESRQLLPVNDPIYGQSYGVRSLYELLDEAARHEGGTHVLFNQQTAWPRLMALFRLIHDGSSHGAHFRCGPYGGVLFRPGDDNQRRSRRPSVAHPGTLRLGRRCHDPSTSSRSCCEARCPSSRGRSKTYVEGPVDYTDLRTEFIGLIYEGLLDYRLKRTDEEIGPQVFLNIGREPVLPLSRLRTCWPTTRRA